MVIIYTGLPTILCLVQVLPKDCILSNSLIITIAMENIIGECCLIVLDEIEQKIVEVFVEESSSI